MATNLGRNNVFKFTIKAGVFRESLLTSCVDFNKCSTFIIYAYTREEAFTKIKEANGEAGAWYEYRFKVLLVEEVQL